CARGLWVTWWEAVRAGGRPVSPGRWGRVLRAFHALPPPGESDGLVLPGYDAFDRTARRLRTPPAGPAAADVAFLRDRLSEVRERVVALRFPSSPVPVHGDAHPGNALVGALGAGGAPGPGRGVQGSPGVGSAADDHRCPPHGVVRPGGAGGVPARVRRGRGRLGPPGGG
ncbi:phosphotransferase, partial [Streptomyces calidiresistens]|nr:phosphotransferase [Streptomyces calidiresistens]